MHRVFVLPEGRGLLKTQLVLTIANQPERKEQIEMQETNTTREMFKASHIARTLGLSRQRVYQMCDEGVLPHLRMGHAIFFPARAWEQWLAQANEQALSVAAETKEASNGRD
jgi:excisionase family DNA binding protein